MAAYDLDAAVREDVGEPFVFTLGGKEFTLPHQKDVDKSMLAAADAAGGSAILQMLKVALGKQWIVFDRIPLSVDGVEKLYSAWNEHSGVKQGE